MVSFRRLLNGIDALDSGLAGAVVAKERVALGGTHCQAAYIQKDYCESGQRRAKAERRSMIGSSYQ